MYIIFFAIIMFSPQRQNYDQIPYISWKGQTFQQVTATLQKNMPRSDNAIVMTQHRRNPLKIYRKEIVTQPTGTTCNRASATIADMMDRPGAAITLAVNQAAPQGAALSTLDFNLVNNLTERPGTCPSSVCQDPASNALRRVRSAGMIKRNTTNSAVPKYFTDKQQYLANRGLGYQQNEFHFLRTDTGAANGTVKPGSTADSVNNTFYGNVSLNYCPGSTNRYIPSYYKPNNPGFAQQGGVSASARSANVKYQTIVSAAATVATPFGPSTASALSYGTTSNSPNGVTYSYKDKIGFPNTQCPKFPPAGLQGTATTCFVPPIVRPA
jgi:hypothetical protein